MKAKYTKITNGQTGRENAEAITNLHGPDSLGVVGIINELCALNPLVGEALEVEPNHPERNLFYKLGTHIRKTKSKREQDAIVQDFEWEQSKIQEALNNMRKLDPSAFFTLEVETKPATPQPRNEEPAQPRIKDPERRLLLDQIKKRDKEIERLCDQVENITADRRKIECWLHDARTALENESREVKRLNEVSMKFRRANGHLFEENKKLKDSLRRLRNLVAQRFNRWIEAKFGGGEE